MPGDKSVAARAGDDDSKLRELFGGWKRQLDFLNNKTDDLSDEESLSLIKIEEEIAAVPAEGAGGLAVKAAILAHFNAPLNASDLSFGLWKSLCDDAARALPEAVPIAAIVERRGRPARRDPDLAARAEALIEECATPLPAGDRGLVEAEQRIARLLEIERRQLAEDAGDGAPWQMTLDAVNRLDDLIAAAEPQGAAGAAVKLRRMLDPELGINGADDGDRAELRQVLAVIERAAEGRRS